MTWMLSKITKVCFCIWCFWPLTTSTTSEVKNDRAHIITQGIYNKFIDINFCMGCLVWSKDIHNFGLVLHMCFDKFLLTFESCDLSQADKSIKRVSSFPKLFLLIKFTVYQITICHLTSWQNWCFCLFYHSKIASLKSKHFSHFFWWEVNLRGLRAFILKKVQLLRDSKRSSATHHSVKERRH